MNVIYIRSFVKSFQNYNETNQELIYNTIEATLRYIKTGQAAYGLRIKKLHKRIYESRINIHLRIAYFKGKDMVKFFCLGDHDDIKHCLETLKQHLK